MKLRQASLTAICLLTFVQATLGQSHSDLIGKVDSIVKIAFKYQPKPVKLSITDTQSQPSVAIWESPSSFPDDGYPLIILNGHPVVFKELEAMNLRLKDVVRIRTFQPNDQDAEAIFGTRGANGVILIITK